VNLADRAPSLSPRWRVLRGAVVGTLVFAIPSVGWAAPPEPTRSTEPDAVIEIVPHELEPALEDETIEPEPEDDAIEPEPEDVEPEDEPAEPTIAIRPPRIDGPYFGLLAIGSANFAKVLAFDTPSPLLGGGGFLQAGDAVLKWLSLGIAVGGHTGFSGSKQLKAGGLLVELGFIPSQRLGLSIRTAFGFGGGRIVDRSTGERPGFGGALFKGSLRYEFFPLAEKKRPDRGGGWAIGPELGWLGATPAAKGQPFVHTIMLGLSTSIYFGG
jgi:hypothetical protein